MAGTLSAGNILLDAGSNSAPSIAATTSPTVGILFPAANTLAFSTSSTERFRIDSGGAIASTANIDFKVGASYNTAFRIETTGQLYNSVESTVGTDYRSTLYPGTLCRAWVNFDGTLSGTIIPNASFNITNVTKTATGTYTINFTTAMPDANYALAGSSKGPLDDSQGVQPANVTTPFTTTNAQIYSLQNLGTASGGGPYDSPIISAMFFR